MRVDNPGALIEHLRRFPFPRVVLRGAWEAAGTSEDGALVAVLPPLDTAPALSGEEVGIELNPLLRCLPGLYSRNEGSSHQAVWLPVDVDLEETRMVWSSPGHPETGILRFRRFHPESVHGRLDPALSASIVARAEETGERLSIPDALDWKDDPIPVAEPTTLPEHWLSGAYRTTTANRIQTARRNAKRKKEDKEPEEIVQLVGTSGYSVLRGPLLGWAGRYAPPIPHVGRYALPIRHVGSQEFDLTFPGEHFRRVMGILLRSRDPVEMIVSADAVLFKQRGYAYLIYAKEGLRNPISGEG